MKIDTPSGGHVFQQTGTSFELRRSIIRPNVRTKFHEDWTINMTSIVKTVPPPGGHVFKRSGTIFKHTLDIKQTNGLTYFDHDQDFIRKNLWTKFHENPTKI
ncbi:hypothetical protein DPMN_152025 [Dreissena polymorpha]|uniref:Uncharacterized protein n=1 Tax=Dreissena polymorpha TaxID=45954 RepID=A0A9D4J3I4_DREPO|nr:hypothetical protein DPMN_152025 [Dreissena polymorpha]